MGVFDYVECEAKLPKPEPVDGEYQTKDFDNPQLDFYRIDKDGNLWRRTHLNSPEEKCAFTGTVNFYSHTANTGRWKEYRAVFDTGKMVSAEDVSGESA